MAKRLDKLEQNFLDTIKENNLINKGDVIVVGVSGGPDSITLLTCLNKYKDYLGAKLICAHINHLIRKDSTEDEQFVENVCEKMGIKCYVKRAEVEKIAKEQKKGTEEVGRKIRYDFFNEVAEKENANKIAIAHNMNDNAETMLLNIIRGSGLPLNIVSSLSVQASNALSILSITGINSFNIFSLANIPIVSFSC